MPLSYSTLANDELMGRRSRSVTINIDDGADESGEELRGGAGIPESDELSMSYNNRERIMALFARLLGRVATQEDVDGMLRMGEDDEDVEEEEEDGEGSEDMSVEMPE